jgi:hypothetical protein
VQRAAGEVNVTGRSKEMQESHFMGLVMEKVRKTGQPQRVVLLNTTKGDLAVTIEPIQPEGLRGQDYDSLYMDERV